MIRLKHLLELVTKHRIECDKCSWSWKIADGGSDLYVCHRCGHDNAPKDEADINT
jgi:ribosomal protein L37AE/L43A